MRKRFRESPVEILLVEDNPGDIRLTQEALRSGKVCNNLNVVSDGAEALAFLRREAKYAHAPHPNLVVLDLNLPRKNGYDVLTEMKTDESLKHIPVVILTTSESEEDVLKAYRLHANCYIAKPVRLDQFFEAVRSLQDFWLTTIELPPE
jgi:CheY-like chemotaxis protein